jgi:hypothetical protein
MNVRADVAAAQMTITDTALISGAKWGLPFKTPVAEQPTGRDRREAERIIHYWEAKANTLGQNATIAELDLGAINDTDWSNRFVIALDERIERSSLLLYGAKFAELLDLPANIRRDQPLVRQLPQRFSEVFLHGCAEAPLQMAPVRLEGEIERPDDRVEQYRAVFIAVGVKPNSLTHFALGAFNSRVVERPLAA